MRRILGRGLKTDFSFPKRGGGGVCTPARALLCAQPMRPPLTTLLSDTLHRASPGSIPRATSPHSRGLIGAPADQPREATASSPEADLALARAHPQCPDLVQPPVLSRRSRRGPFESLTKLQARSRSEPTGVQLSFSHSLVDFVSARLQGHHAPQVARAASAPAGSSLMR